MAADPLTETASASTLGRYRLLAQLGQGGMGTIHLALMRGSGEFEKLVVLKELRPDLTKNKAFVSMFLHEAKLAGRLNHTNIVQTLEAGHVGERYFLSMEYLDGQAFSDLLFRNEAALPVPLPLRLHVVCEVLAGLHYAHELRDFDQKPLLIVHCDVSPSNVFITYDGSVKVIDFGVARASGKLGKPGSFQGTLRYAAPEQLLGKPVDRRADIFSAGVLLWEAVALSQFSKGTMDQDGINRRINGLETRLSQAMPHVDSTLAEICDRALSVDPNERYPTAEQFRVALVDYAQSLGHRMDSSEIARIMRTRFATKRAAKHLLIQKQFKEQSSDGALPILHDSTSGHDDVTTVADLSTFVRATRRSEPPQDAEPLLQNARARRRLPLYLAAGGLSLIALVGLSSILSGSSDSPGKVESETATTKEVQPADQNRADSPQAYAPPTEPNEAEDATTEKREQREPNPPSSRTAKSGSSRSTSTSKRSSAAAAAPQNHATATALPTEPAAAPVAPAPSPAPTTRPPASNATFGQDLGAPAQRERRMLDADNPFR